MRFGKRCSLCGGKLDRQKRCTECGLDNTKNDEMYKHLANQSNCENRPLTHVHSHKKVTEEDKRIEVRYTRPVQNAKTGNIRKQKKPAGCSKVIGIMVLLFGVLPGLLSGVFGVVREVVQEEESWVAHLEPGIYDVGVHIPSAEYRMEIDGEGYGYIEVGEYVEGEYYGRDFYYLDDTETTGVEDILLEEHDLLLISPGMRVHAYTTDEVGDTETQEGNPLTESVDVSGNAIAGEDFQAGVYDIVYEPDPENEYGEVGIYIWNEEKGVVIYNTELYFDNFIGETTYHNVVLPKGSEIVVTGLKNITLVPSMWISPDIDLE